MIFLTQSFYDSSTHKITRHRKFNQWDMLRIKLCQMWTNMIFKRVMHDYFCVHITIGRIGLFVYYNKYSNNMIIRPGKLLLPTRLLYLLLHQKPNQSKKPKDTWWLLWTNHVCNYKMDTQPFCLSKTWFGLCLYFKPRGFNVQIKISDWNLSFFFFFFWKNKRLKLNQ